MSGENSSAAAPSPIIVIPEIDNNAVPVDIKVTNDVFDIVISSKGGNGIKSIDLRDYKQDNTKGKRKLFPIY